jgi:uncharacterized protein YkwD
MTSGRKYFLFYAVLAMASGAALANAQEVPIDIVTLKAGVLSQTNAYRKSKNLPELKPNASLDTAAQAYAVFLAQNDKTGHTADGSTHAKRAYAQGYKWCFVAENLWYAWNGRGINPLMVDDAARKAMEGWKKSPAHNANLLEARVYDIGIGAASWKQPNGKEAYRVVQMFGHECPGKPRPAPTAGEILDSAVQALR